MCCFVLILSSLRRTLRFALVKEVVTGTYNDPLRENKKHTLKKEEREREMTTMMMMMDQTRVVLYQYIHYEHVSTLHQNERGRLRGVVGIRSGNRSHPPLPAIQASSFVRGRKESESVDSTKLQVTHFLQIREFYSRKDYAFAAFLVSVISIHKLQEILPSLFMK